MLDEKSHQIEGLFMVDEYGWEIEGGLSGLRFEPIDDNGVIFLEEALYGLDGAAYQQVY